MQFICKLFVLVPQTPLSPAPPSGDQNSANKSKRVKMIYFDKENHDIEETNTETFMCRSVCHQRLHRVINDQRIANDLILQ